MKKTYFISDFHLGAPDIEVSRIREKKIVRWLDKVRADAETIYLLGDVFDFWHDYKKVVPKGFTRLIGKLAELSDAGIKIEYFTGNHDLWMNGYLEEEVGLNIYKEPEERTISGKSFFVGHGDGLGPGEGFYKVLRKFFHNSLSQWLFKWIHPDIGMRLAQLWSRKSREKSGEEAPFTEKEKEYLYQFCKQQLKQKHYDFFIFGHRHLPLDLILNEKGSRYINVGEWISQYSYAEFDGENLQLKYFKD